MNKGAERNLIVERGDVIGLHANAAVTGRTSDDFFLRRAMNVNAAAKRMRVRRFEPTQPDDASNDWVAPGGVWRKNLAGEAAVMKNCAERRVIADFLRDLEEAERRGHAAPAIAQSVFGS